MVETVKRGYRYSKARPSLLGKLTSNPKLYTTCTSVHSQIYRSIYVYIYICTHTHALLDASSAQNKQTRKTKYENATALTRGKQRRLCNRACGSLRVTGDCGTSQHVVLLLLISV